MSFPFIKYISISLLLLVILAINLISIHSKIIGVLFVFSYGWFISNHLGMVLMPGYHKSWQRVTGALGFLCSVIIIGTLGYYLFELSNNIAIISLCITAFVTPCIAIAHTLKTKKLSAPTDDTATVSPRSLNTWIGCLIVIIGDCLLLDYLYRHGTMDAIRTPWSMVTLNFFILFAITSFFLLRTITQQTGKWFAIIATFLHASVLLSVGYFIYQLGFGFDPFIHRAAETHISEFGVLFPKTPFYIGQYALVALINKFTFLPVALIDTLLLPALEIIFLPQLVYSMLRHGFTVPRINARIGAVLFFLIPFASFITTTPYELAAFLGICALLYGTLYIYTKTLRAAPLILLTLGSLAVHPLAGIPALIITLSAIIIAHPVTKINRKLYSLLIAIFYAVSALAIPLAFTIYLKLQTGLWGDLPSFATLLSRLPEIPLPLPREGFGLKSLFTPLYLYYFLTPLFFIFFSWFGYRAWKKNNQTPLLTRWFLPSMYLIIIINALVVRFFIRLPGIGDHEQFQYSDRIIHFATYILVPFFLYGLLEIKKNIQIKNKGFIVSAAISLVLACALTASLYASYPRVDAYTLDKFINTSATDLHTVRAIDAHASKEPYVVLSNISTAAAALQEFGFTHTENAAVQGALQPSYFQTQEGELFFYSIPTGGPLYLAYLHMAETNPDRATADYVRSLTGAHRVYLIINDYWHTFKKITPLAKQTANEWFTIDNGKALVFVYK